MTSSPSRVPVFSSFAAGWSFLFLRIHRLVLRLWLPVGLLYLLQIAEMTPQALIASAQASVEQVLLAFLLHLTVTVFIVAGAYRAAFGEEHRFFLGRLELGPDEVRLLFAKLGLWLTFGLLYFGSFVVTEYILIVLMNAGIIVSDIAGIPRGELTWLQELIEAEPFISFGMLALFAIVMGWLGLRYTLVFASIVAERRFIIFDALALTKNNTWRLSFLAVLLWLSLMLVMKGPFIAAGVLSYDLASADEGSAFDVLNLMTTYDLGPPLQFDAPDNAQPTPPSTSENPFYNAPPSETEKQGIALPNWLAPLITVLGNVLWQIVFAGALAHAYRSVASPARSNRLG